MTLFWLAGAVFTSAYLDTGFWKSLGCLLFWPGYLGEYFREKDSKNE